MAGASSLVSSGEKTRPNPSESRNVREERTPWRVRAHNCSARVELDESLLPGESVIESYLEKRDKEFEETDDGYITYINGWKIRLTPNYLIVFLADEFGEDVVDVKNRVYEQAREKIEKIENETPLALKHETLSPRFSIRRQELALMDDPFAEACVESDDIDLSEQKYRDQDENLRFVIDASGGVPELEFQHTELAEEDADFYREDVVGELIENKSEWRELFEREKLGQFDDFEDALAMVARVMLMSEMRDFRDRGRGEMRRSVREKSPASVSLSDDTIDFLIERLDSLDIMKDYDAPELDDSVDRALRLRELEKSMDERMERLDSRG